MECKNSLASVMSIHSLAFFDKVCSETIDSSFGEFFAASFAGMFVSVTRIVELGTSLKVLEDEGCEIVRRGLKAVSVVR